MLEKSKSSHLVACAVIGVLLAIGQTFYARTLPITDRPIYTCTSGGACPVNTEFCGAKSDSCLSPGYKDLAISGEFIGLPFAVPKKTEFMQDKNRNLKLYANFILSTALPFGVYFAYLSIPRPKKTKK